VAIIIGRRNDEVSLIIEDNGRGFDVEEALRRGRLGLLGMRERTEMLGGTVTIESAPGRGTTLYVQAPVPLVS
jgi:signal transduction histidine kinase